MLSLRERADLERLIDEQIAESLVLEYKASDSVGRSDGRKKEMTKDVTAFANSAGGQIIYGIPEQDGLPQPFDQGVDSREYSKEWFEHVLNSTISPRIEGLEITAVPLSEGRAAYVLNIPAATSRAPHQAWDKRYYKRHNFESTMMDDYEIRDLLRRDAVPDPYMTIVFEDGRRTIDLRRDDVQRAGAIPFKIYLKNRSKAPAYYCSFSLFFDARLELRARGEFDNDTVIRLDSGRDVHILTRMFAIPNHFPLFAEHPIALIRPMTRIMIQPILRGVDMDYDIGYEFRVPGRHVMAQGRLIKAQHSLTIDLADPLEVRCA